MNIGIVSNGNDTLALFKIFTKHPHNYLIYHDQTHFPFGTKDITIIGEEVKKAVSFLLSQGAETVIVDPVYEMTLLMHAPHEAAGNYEGGQHILPLFTTYLHSHAFPRSLVGKIWILTDFASKDSVQSLVAAQAERYQLTASQQATKKFHFPFAYRVKAAHARPAGIADLGNHNPYLIRTLKNDLKYFKDANVDTILPLHYHYFRMQRTIKGYFNFRKTRFHDLSVVEECFVSLTKSPLPPFTKGGDEKGKYAVQIRTNQDPSFLLKEKELVRLLQRGKEIELKIERI